MRAVCPHRWLMVVVVVLVVACFCGRVAAQSSDRDPVRNALEDLYHATAGDLWLERTNWLIGSPCPYGGWFGVVCNEYLVEQLYVTASIIMNASRHLHDHDNHNGIDLQVIAAHA